MEMNPKDYIRAEEVALRLGVSVKTIQNWYSFKKNYPDNEYAQYLPDYIKIGNRNTRYWLKEDLWKLAEYKAMIPHGHNGVMGGVTQKYYHNKKENANG